MRATIATREHSPRHWKMLAQRRLRQVLELLEDDAAEFGDAFVLMGDAEVAIDELQQQREDEGHG